MLIGCSELLFQIGDIGETQAVFFSGRLRTFEVPVELSTEADGMATLIGQN